MSNSTARSRPWTGHPRGRGWRSTGRDRPERRRQVDDVQSDYRRRRADGGRMCSPAPTSPRCRRTRARGSDRALLPNPAPFTNMRCSRTCWSARSLAAHERAGQLRALQRRAGAHRPLDKANVPARTLTLLQRKRLELARALATPAEASAARRDRRRPDRARMRRAGQDHQGDSRARHDHCLDRAHRARAGLGCEPSGRDEFRPEILAQGDPHAVMADARVREVYMGIPAS